MTKMTFLARMKVHADREQDFLRLVAALTEKVREHEPETLAYEFFRLEGPLHYAVYEQFSNAEAEEKHRNMPYFSDLAGPMVECLDGGYHREYLLPLDGGDQ
ncbi:putative quinol monooxygenase [Emcibacter sp.]|uniref:putative quinol monooxygenase n=1 Tax=Emcibacter sp. TaxID=1979954 RepID=UPI002AA74450|nr:antibiotic biosynthesis monooxygenase [Emcibacter sp.]